MEKKKYIMIVFEEDERYDRKEKQLSFWAENPWEGNLRDIVAGDSPEELVSGSPEHDNEGMFYLLYSGENGRKIGSGVVSHDAIEEDILEWIGKGVEYEDVGAV